MKPARIEVLVCSNKQLAEQKGELAGETVWAVQCSSGPLKDADYEWLTRRLFLEFDDTTEEGMSAFQPEQAEKAAVFVKDVPEGALLYFCCDAGVSRSSALAAAYLRSRGRGEEEMDIWGDPYYYPNTRVYRLQCRAYGIRVTWLSLKRRIRANEKPYKKHGRMRNFIRTALRRIRKFPAAKGER